MVETNNILSVLDSYTLNNSDDIAIEIADAFRKRRIEKNLTREQVAEQSGVVVSNIVRFEKKGLISLKNLIGIAIALCYTSEIKSLFDQPKYSTMEELTQKGAVAQLKGNCFSSCYCHFCAKVRKNSPPTNKISKKIFN